MNIRDLAYSVYSNREWNHIAGPKDGPLYTMSWEEYSDYVVAENQKRWASGEAQKEFLFAGSENRASLSEAEAIALANKYDTHSMDGADYDALLDDLESMGAISPFEKGLLGYNGCVRLGYVDESGEFVTFSRPSVDVRPADGEGTYVDGLRAYDRGKKEDLWQWINACVGQSQFDSGDLSGRAHKVLAGIMNRMAALRPEKTQETEEAEAEEPASDEKAELLRRIKDPEENFFGKMQRQILESAEKRQEEQKKQATIDALSAILDSLSGRDDDGHQDTAREIANGVKLGLSADQENTFRKGYIPLELQVFLRNLGVSGSFEAVEPDESEKEPERVSGPQRSEDAVQEAAAELAERYDPRQMSQEEFRNFMDDLAESGAMDAGAAERVKNAGQWIVTVTDEDGNVVEPLAWKENGPALADSRIMPFLFGEHSMDGDVLAWAQLGSANRDFRDLVDILTRMESQRKQTVSEII